MSLPLKKSSLKPGAVILETFERLDRLTSLQPGPRLGSHLPLLSCIVLQILSDLSRYPGVTKPGPPWLPRAGWGLPACFSSVPEKPKLASLLFLFSGVSTLYVRKGLLCSWDPILSWGVGEVMSERKMVFDKLVQFEQSHDFPVIAHHCFSTAIVSAPKYLAKWEAGKGWGAVRGLRA